MRKLIFSFCLMCYVLSAQVGIGKNQPGETFQPEATLDIRAKLHNGSLQNSDGLAVPRVNEVAVNGVENGQLIYLIQDDTVNGYPKGFLFWQNGSWVPISSSGLNSTGGEQMYAGYWSIGNVTSSNDMVTNIRGNIVSVMYNPTLSLNDGTTYDVVMDKDYLQGDLGVDFQIVSALETGTAGSARFDDARTFRAVSRTSDNSFQITFWNLESSSARQIRTSIAVLRNTNLTNIEASGSNLGLHNTLTELTTSYPNPYQRDVAELSIYDPTLVHINGTTVPTGQDSYSVYFNGTDWVYTGWRNNLTVPTSWIVDPEGLTVNGTVSDPKKANTPDFDIVRYRELENKWVEVEIRYGAESNTGADDGTGEYLFRLPNNFQFDPNEHLSFTGSGVITNSVASSLSLPVDQSILSQNGQSGSEAFLIPYNKNSFRCLTYSGSIANDYAKDGHYSMNFTDKVFYFRFRFKRI